jgi:hypothetical protein
MDPPERAEALATLNKLLADAAGGGRVALISGAGGSAVPYWWVQIPSAYVEVLARKV